jgi:hypothetical protein
MKVLSSITVVGASAAIVSTAANYLATTLDYTILCDATSGAVTVTLPTTPITGQILNIKKTDSTAYSVIIARGGTSLIDGVTSVSFATQYETFTLQYDGTNWWII